MEKDKSSMVERSWDDGLNDWSIPTEGVSDRYDYTPIPDKKLAQTPSYGMIHREPAEFVYCAFRPGTEITTLEMPNLEKVRAEENPEKREISMNTIQRDCDARRIAAKVAEVVAKLYSAEGESVPDAQQIIERLNNMIH